MPGSTIRQDVGCIVDTAARAKGGTTLTIENRLRPPSGRPAGPMLAAAFSCSGDQLVTLDSHGQLVALKLDQNRYVAVRRFGARGALAWAPWLFLKYARSNYM